MEDRLNQIAERLRQVERELADPAVYSDQQRLKNLSREQKELTPVVENFTALQQTEQAIAEAREMLSDPELRELAQEELTRTKEQRERLAEELKRLLLPRDPNDEKSVVLEIRGGVGGEEGALFAADLLRMYTMYAERRGWQLEIVSQNVTELGGVKEVCATVEGDGAWSRLKFEAGTHRVQRVPETESGGRIRRHGGGDAGGGGDGALHRPQGSADRHLPLQRCRRAARQQDRVRHPHYTSALRHGGGVSGRAEPV